MAGKPLDKFKKMKHQNRMLSLNDVFGDEELSDWEKRIKKLTRRERINYFCEVKFDGLAVSLIYKDGKFVRGATRGDGFIGVLVGQPDFALDPVRARACAGAVTYIIAF